jgi:hypothetical protein
LEPATTRHASRRGDELLLDSPGSRTRHLVEALGLAGLQQGHRALCCKVHASIEHAVDASLEAPRELLIAWLGGLARRIGHDLGIRALSVQRARHGDRSLDLVRVREIRHEEQEGQRKP